MSATTPLPTSLDGARSLTSAGFSCIPVPWGQKKPVLDGWQQLRIAQDDLPKYFGSRTNIGVLCGEPSGWRVDVDCDVPEARELAPDWLPSTPLVHGRPGNPLSHWWYRAPMARTRKFQFPFDSKQETMIVELRANGQTVVPVSRHPSGEHYRWEKQGEPALVSYDDLARRVAIVAAGALLARSWPGEGSRDQAAMALCGGLLRAGWPAGETDRFVQGVARVAGDEEWRHRGKAARTDQVLKDGEKQVTGFPALSDLLHGDGNRILSKVREWLNITAKSEAEPPAWDEPVPLYAELLPVKQLDPWMIPDAIRHWTQDVAHRMQAPLDFVVAAAIVAAGALVGRRLGISPKQYDDWVEPLNLWGMGVGLPSSMKTPGQQEVLKVVRWLQATADDEYEQAEAKYNAQQQVTKVRKDVLFDQAKKAAKVGNETLLASLTDDLAALEKPRPVRTRYYTSDTTVEKLGEILSDRPEGMLIWRDELMGWLKGLEKQGRDTDRAFYLESHGGKLRFPTDRISRGSLAPMVCLSILGGIQPGPLSRYVRGATAVESENNDGLLQRFQVLVWPNKTAFTYVDQWPEKEAKDLAYGMYRKLATADVVEEFGAEKAVDEPDAMPSMHFSEDAQPIFAEWYTALQVRLRTDEEIPAALNAHLGKYASLMPKLATLFHLMDIASGAESPGPVSTNATIRAMAWCEYLESHACRVYRSAISADMARAGNLLKHIRRGEVADRATLREIYLHHWEDLTTREEVEAAIRTLADYGWARIDTEQPETGRPSSIIRLHPSLEKCADALDD